MAEWQLIALALTIVGTGVGLFLSLGGVMIKYGRTNATFEGEFRVVNGKIDDLRQDVRNNLDERRRLWERIDAHEGRLGTIETRCRILHQDPEH